ncbi:MAG: carbamoyltransferase C-terminal domain-containing protein [Nibricoccus sp.]
MASRSTASPTRRLLREGAFRELWIQPAAGDAGGALGAALAYHHHQAAAQTPPPSRAHVARKTDSMHGSFLGPAYSDSEIAATLSSTGLLNHAEKLSPEILNARIAQCLAAGNVIGFCQGRAEFGPRALGARSILADARSPDMQRRLNLKIKARESFRPFAPIVLAERAFEFFEIAAPSPYMLFTAPVASAQRLAAPAADTSWQQRLATPHSTIPAVTHVDYSARLQTVARDENPPLHAVLTAFADLTGCPVLVNTSFNVRGEPPVCHPREAIAGFLATDMDALVFGPYFLEKKSIPPNLLPSAPARNFAPD